MRRRRRAGRAFLAAVAIIGLGLAAPGARAATPSLSPAPAPAATLELGGRSCPLLGVPAALPLGVATSCPGVRPGAAVRSPVGLCSFNFMWRGADGATYMGTAGHCILASGGGPLAGDDDQEQVWAPGSGPEARDSQGQRVGEFAYAVLRSPSDFALVRLDPGVPASPQMCHFGGPTGVNADNPGLLEPVVLHQYGQGVGLGALVPGRTMLALGMPSADHVYATGLVVPGDSGSGVISADGRAVGVVVTTGVHGLGLGLGGLDAGLAGITRLPPQVARAGALLGTALTLQTAPLLP